MKSVLRALTLAVASAALASAQIFSEFQPNPDGDDPDTSPVELSGTPGEFFDGWVISIESNAVSDQGVVDEVAQVNGTFDSNGLLVVSIPDFENPSHTYVLLTDFNGTLDETDVDTDNDGIIDDFSTLNGVLDALQVPDADGEPLYGSQLGGQDLTHTGGNFAEPSLVFRSLSTGDWFQVVDGLIYDVDGVVVNPDFFRGDDATQTTVGAINPEFDNVNVPSREPTVPPPPTPAPSAGPTLVNQVLLNEFRPNPRGVDPATQQVELKGPPGMAFDGWLISIESDLASGEGQIDHAEELSGTFDDNGILVVEMDDFENPSHTYVLMDAFAGDVSNLPDIDTNDDGTLDDTSMFGTVFDAINVPDSNGGAAGINYGAQLGGVNLAFAGREPELLFRDATTNAWYNVIDGVSIFDQAGSELNALDFQGANPLIATFGTANPSFGIAVLISEVEPNPAGNDPPTQSVEISGVAGEAFSGWFLSVESDDGNSGLGLVDRATPISGTFDVNGLLTTTVADLENPAHTYVLATGFSGTVDVTDLDTDNDGVLDDLSSLTGILDALQVPDEVGEPLYGSQLGGEDLTFAGDEPSLVFRESSRGPWYAIVNGDVFVNAGGGNINATLFDSDPTAATFGSVNPGPATGDVGLTPAPTGAPTAAATDAPTPAPTVAPTPASVDDDDDDDDDELSDGIIAAIVICSIVGIVAIVAIGAYAAGLFGGSGPGFSSVETEYAN